GDVNTEMPVLASAVMGEGDSVVKVASVNRIDGDNGVGRQIFSSMKIVFPKGGRSFARLFQNCLGKSVRKIEFPNDRERIDTRPAARPQHFRDDALSSVFRRRKANHFHDDLVFGSRSLRARIADKNTVAEDRAVNPDQSLAVSLQVSADKLPGCPF